MMIQGMAIDGLICIAMKKRYRVRSSFMACMFWPINLVLEIIVAAKATKHREDINIKDLME
jgi:hypothetical protein